MIQSIDIYNEARRKMSPLESICYTIGETIKDNPKLNDHEMISSLNRSARAIKLGIGDLSEGCSPEKAMHINQQIVLASTHLAKYVGWVVVNKFISEETL